MVYTALDKDNMQMFGTYAPASIEISLNVPLTKMVSLFLLSVYTRRAVYIGRTSSEQFLP